LHVNIDDHKKLANLSELHK